MAPQQKIKAAAYIRVSTAIQVSDGESMTTQRQQVTDFAKQRDWQLVNIYADEGISGAKIEYRTQFQQMIKDAKAGKFSVIVFTKLSRFARNAREYQNMAYELRQYGVTLASVKENIDPTTKTGQMIAGILSLFAEWEHETIREQMYENKMIRWREHRTFIGKPPFGYRWNKEKRILEVDERESETYRRIVSMYIDQGLAFRDIAIRLNAEGIKCKRAGWSSPVISYILKNPAYYGHYVVNQLVYKDGKNGAGTQRTKEKKAESEMITFPIPTLVTKTEWDRIQATTQFRRVKTKRGTDTSFFLRDVLVCGVCSGRVKPHVGNQRKDGTRPRYYRCYWSGTSKKREEFGRKIKCTLPELRAEILEQAVWSDILVMFALNPKKAFGTLFDPVKNDTRIRELNESIDHLESDLKSKTRERERLYKLLTFDDVDLEEIRAKLRLNKDETLTIEGNLNEAREKLQNATALKNEEKKLMQFLEGNKSHFTKLRQEIRALDMKDHKLLVEGMLTGKAVVDYEPAGTDSPGGPQIDFKLRFNPEIIQRFINEGKLSPLNKNSKYHYSSSHAS